MKKNLNITILFGTIAGTSYFLLFEPDSTFATTLITLAPLGWAGLFGIRFLGERKKKKDERKLNPKSEKKEFKAPEDYL